MEGHHQLLEEEDNYEYTQNHDKNSSGPVGGVQLSPLDVVAAVSTSDSNLNEKQVIDELHETPMRFENQEEEDVNNLFLQEEQSTLFSPIRTISLSKLKSTNYFAHFKAFCVLMIVFFILLGILIGVVFIRLDRIRCEPFKTGYLSEFKQIPISVSLNERQNNVLKNLIPAAHILDKIYLNQVYSKNEMIASELKKRGDCGGKVYEYFKINYGPWSRIDNDKMFVNGLLSFNVSSKKPPGANFYPEDMTRDEFNNWLQTLDEKDRWNATAFYHTIRRDHNGQLKSVPYSEEYRDDLQKVSQLLIDASKHMIHPSMIRYTNTLAQALITNSYHLRDEAWIDAVSDKDEVDYLLGPFETYEDRLFGFKATFSAYIGVVDREETSKLENIIPHLQSLENNLPLDAKYKRKLAKNHPVIVFDLIYSSGEARAGIQYTSFTYPQDNQVIYSKGTKRVVLKNVQIAKFEAILNPLGMNLIEEKQKQYIQLDSFLIHQLTRELVSELGPRELTVNNTDTGEPNTYLIRHFLREYHYLLSEIKEEIGGLWALLYLVNNDKIDFMQEKSGAEVDNNMKRSFEVTFIAYLLKNARYRSKLDEGRAALVIINYLRQAKALIVQKNVVEDGGHDQTSPRIVHEFSVNFALMEEACKELLGEIFDIQTSGYEAYDKAKQFAQKYSKSFKELDEMLDYVHELKIPIDIRLVFKNAEGIVKDDLNLF